MVRITKADHLDGVVFTSPEWTLSICAGASGWSFKIKPFPKSIYKNFYAWHRGINKRAS